MIYWETIYFPPSHQNNSPYDYIISLEDQDEQRRIVDDITAICKIELPIHWPRGFRVHKIKDKVWQFDAGGQHRVAYCLDEGKIMILHVFKKDKNKTRQTDKDRALSHYGRFITEKQNRR